MSAGKTIIRVAVNGMPAFRRADDGRPLVEHMCEIKDGILALGDPRKSVHKSHALYIDVRRMRLCEDGTQAKAGESIIDHIEWDAQAPCCLNGLPHDWRDTISLCRADGRRIHPWDREDCFCLTWNMCRHCGCEHQRVLEDDVFFDRYVSVDGPGNLCSKYVPRCEDCGAVLGWDAEGRRVKDCPECEGDDPMTTQTQADLLARDRRRFRRFISEAAEIYRYADSPETPPGIAAVLRDAADHRRHLARGCAHRLSGARRAPMVIDYYRWSERDTEP